MKPINAIKFFALLLTGITFLITCTNDKKALVAPVASAEIKEPNPFPFYKSIEIKPGLNFEVVSWGKGVDSLGGYLILMSDSTKNNYKSISVERNGIITDAWNMDLDNDGNPELYIQYVARKNVSDLNVYEYANGSFDKISFPSLKSVKGYEGNDKFYVKNGDLFRSIPTVTIDSGKTSTLVKTLKYSLRGNSFSISAVK